MKLLINVKGIPNVLATVPHIILPTTKPPFNNIESFIALIVTN
jgi:hypothetical protein